MISCPTDKRLLCFWLGSSWLLSDKSYIQALDSSVEDEGRLKFESISSFALHCDSNFHCRCCRHSIQVQPPHPTLTVNILSVRASSMNFEYLKALFRVLVSSWRSVSLVVASGAAYSSPRRAKRLNKDVVTFTDEILLYCNFARKER